jgi:hypothetical protein
VALCTGENDQQIRGVDGIIGDVTPLNPLVVLSHGHVNKPIGK